MSDGAAPRAGAADDGTVVRTREFPRAAALYLLFVATIAVGATAPFYANLFGGEEVHGWLSFAILAVAAAVAQIFVVVSPRNLSYHTSVTFLVAAALVLPPELIVLIGIVQNIPEWLKERYPWYIQTFNICNYTLNTLAAWGVAHVILGGEPLAAGGPRVALAGIAACLVFVVTNHCLVAMMVRFARGHSLRETQLFSLESLSVDLVLTAIGVALGVFWLTDPWLIPIAAAPLIVVHRSLSVPQLQAQARIDPKTGLFNTRHFGAVLHEELARAARFERPLSLIMADLDLLRDINNSYGHLAGDAVLKGVAEIFRAQLRHIDVPARFGGEEFSILLPETSPEEALAIAERIRREVAAREFEVETSDEPIRATLSLGVAGFPGDATDSNDLIHQADLAVYRAKLQGRNRVTRASSEPMLAPSKRTRRLAVLPPATETTLPPPRRRHARPEQERRGHARADAPDGPRIFSAATRLRALVASVSVLGIGGGIIGAVFGSSQDFVGLLAVAALVAAGQALALEVLGQGTLSVSAVGSLAGAALFGPRAALLLAAAAVAVEWSARRHPMQQILFNCGTLSLASLAAAAAFALAPSGSLLTVAAGLAAGAAYFGVNIGLLTLALALEGREHAWIVFRERFAWLLGHYVVYGFIGAVIATAYDAAGLYALAVFAVPLLLMRKTQEAYLAHTQKSAQKLREAAETIQGQNASLEQANRLLKERSTAAMESLSATVDARDAYTAGHSRRVRELALAVGRELGLSRDELDLLGQAALFHDIGKLAVPDAILLKPADLSDEEWSLMQRHAEEGGRIIERLGFLNDAVPAIRHHHERWDGKGYPDGLAGEDIPLGARIIHVADAFDSMVTTRVYRSARPVADALVELAEGSSRQFCPRCVAAVERIVRHEKLDRARSLPAYGVAVAS